MKQKDENNKPISTGKPSGNAHQRRNFARKDKPQKTKEHS